MNPIKIVMLSAAALVASAGWSDADARGGGRGHGHGGHHHHSHWRGSVGIWFGAPFFPYYYPRYYAPSYYYPPAYYPYYPSTTVIPAPGSPSVYIEQSPPAAPQSAPAPAQGSGSYWYYCRETQTYYPYVQQCASPWQQVVPHAPGPQSGPDIPRSQPAPNPAPSDPQSAPSA